MGTGANKRGSRDDAFVNVTQYEALLKDFMRLPLLDVAQIENDVMSAVKLNQEKAFHAETVIEKTIRMLETDIMNEISKSFNADALKLGTIKSGFAGCENKKGKFMTKIVSLEAERDEQYAKLSHCKNKQHDETQQLETENAKKNGLDADEKIKCDLFEKTVNDMKDISKRCHNVANSYVEFTIGNKGLFTNFKNEYEERNRQCSDAKKKAKDQKKIRDDKQADLKHTTQVCGEYQDAYEENSCTRLTTTKSINDEYPSCYDPQMKAWRGTVFILRKNEKQRLSQWRALQRIKCLLNVMNAKQTTFGYGNSISAGIEACRSKTYTTDFYNMIWWNPPIKQKRYAVKPFACASDFLVSYEPWKETMEKCQWCDGYEPTPPPTPEPTTTTTPIPPAPTPSPTTGYAASCKLKVYQHGAWLGTKNEYSCPASGCALHKNEFKNMARNDDLSSFSTSGPWYCKFCVYEHEKFGGSTLHEIGTDTSSGWVGSSKNDKASSVKILDRRKGASCR